MGDTHRTVHACPRRTEAPAALAVRPQTSHARSIHGLEINRCVHVLAEGSEPSGVPSLRPCPTRLWSGQVLLGPHPAMNVPCSRKLHCLAPAPWVACIWDTSNADQVIEGQRGAGFWHTASTSSGAGTQGTKSRRWCYRCPGTAAMHASRQDVLILSHIRCCTYARASLQSPIATEALPPQPHYAGTMRQ